MSNVGPVSQNQPAPKLNPPGISSPLEVVKYIDVKIDGKSLVADDITDPNQRAQALIKAFKDKFGVSASELPYLAAVIKQGIMKGIIQPMRQDV